MANLALQSSAQLWLEKKLAEQTGASSGLLLISKNGKLETAAVWPKSTKPEKSLVEVARKSFETNESIARTHYSGPERRKKQRLVSQPLNNEGRLIGAMAYIETAPSDQDPVVDPIVSSAPAAAQMQISSPPKSARLSEQRAMSVLQALVTVLGQSNYKQAVTEVATELARVFGCDRVSIGFKEGQFSTIQGVSHSADIQATHSLLQLITACMDEALDQLAMVQFPPVADAMHRITLSHAELTHRHNLQQLLTMPMVHDNRLIGAIVFERRDIEPFTTEQIDLIENIAVTLGPVLELKRNNEFSWISKLKQQLVTGWVQLFSAEQRALRMAVVASIIFALFLPLIPIEYSTSSPARLEGTIQRVMVAPNDGFLRSVNVRPGDTVVAGQVLAELADEELRQERRRWESEVLRHDSTFGDALKRRDRALMSTAQAQGLEARAQLNLIEQQLSRTRLVAPFAGVVVKGDLKQQIGAPFKRGDTLLVLAPAGQYRVIVSVEDRMIDQVRVGAEGSLRLASMPNSSLPIKVERVLPVAVTQEGRNVFEVEASLVDPPSLLRPGLEGVGKISVGERSMYWIAAHRVFDWFSITLWSWTH